MDSQTQTTIVSYTAVMLSVLGVVIGAVNHRRIRSNCCGHKMETSIDIESTTPPGATVPRA